MSDICEVKYVIWQIMHIVGIFIIQRDHLPPHASAIVGSYVFLTKINLYPSGIFMFGRVFFLKLLIRVIWG